MRKWRLASGVETCGLCGARPPADTPILVIALDRVAARLLRCPVCAGEAPPDVLPPRRTIGAVTPVGFVAVRAIARATLPLDYKTRQSGTPGDEEDS